MAGEHTHSLSLELYHSVKEKMAHFAQLDENNIVTRVLVIDQETINTGAFGDPQTFYKQVIIHMVVFIY